jgi:N4-gp56 family major capsid protein
VTITPQPYGAWLGYTQEINLEAFSPVISQVSQIMGRQAGLSVDTLVRTAIHAGATVDYSGTAAARADVTALVTYDDLVEQLAALQTQDAMPVEGGMFVCVTHPQSIAVLFKDTDFQTVFTREGSGAIRSGKIGTLFNCEFYVTSNAIWYDNAGASSKDVYTMLFIGAEAYGKAGFSGFAPNMGGFEGAGEYDNMTGKQASPVNIIVRGLGETGFDPLKQRGTIGWLLYEEEAILNANWIRSFEHAIV